MGLCGGSNGGRARAPVRLLRDDASRMPWRHIHLPRGMRWRPPYERGGRAFDTLDRQVARNGDGERHLAVKMDIEGAEWQVLRAAPDDTLARIDQLVIEFHETDQRHFVEVIRRLKRTFVVAHVHFNNAACHEGVGPFPSRAYEVLFVNKRIARHDPGGAPPELPLIGLDSPNYPNRPDCQAAWH